MTVVLEPMQAVLLMVCYLVGGYTICSRLADILIAIAEKIARIISK